MKLLWIIVTLYQLKLSQSSTLTANCNFETEKYPVIKNTYRCKVKNGFEVLHKNTTSIEKAVGRHQSRSSNKDVKMFKVENFNVSYFPSGLEKLFINLEGITIISCGLKEIHQADLEPIPNLVYLDLNDNNIKIIKQGIFDFNKNLQVIFLKRNEIVHIDLSAFVNLPNLKILDVQSNNCTMDSEQSDYKAIKREQISNVITNINTTCINLEYRQEIEGKSFEANSTNITDPINTNLLGIESKIELMINSVEKMKNASNQNNENQTEVNEANVGSGNNEQFLILMAKFLIELGKSQEAEVKMIMENQEQIYSKIQNKTLEMQANLTNTIERIDQKVDKIEDKFKNVPEELNAIKAKTEDIVTKNDDINEKVKDIPQKMSQIEGLLDDLSTKVERIEEKVQDVPAIKTDTSNLGTLVEEIENQVYAISDYITNVIKDKTSELADNIKEIADQIKETQNNLTDYQNSSLISANKAFLSLEAIQKTQTQVLPTKCEPPVDTSLSYLNKTLKSILDTQNNISQDLQGLKNFQNESNLTENVTLAVKDFGEVQKTFKNTQTQVAMDIKTIAESTKSEFAKLNQNVGELEDKIKKGIKTELEAVKSGLDDLKKVSQSELKLPATTTVATTIGDSKNDLKVDNEIDESKGVSNKADARTESPEKEASTTTTANPVIANETLNLNKEIIKAIGNETDSISPINGNSTASTTEKPGVILEKPVTPPQNKEEIPTPEVNSSTANPMDTSKSTSTISSTKDNINSTAVSNTDSTTTKIGTTSNKEKQESEGEDSSEKTIDSYDDYTDESGDNTDDATKASDQPLQVSNDVNDSTTNDNGNIENFSSIPESTTLPKNDPESSTVLEKSTTTSPLNDQKGAPPNIEVD